MFGPYGFALGAGLLGGAGKLILNCATGKDPMNGVFASAAIAAILPLAVSFEAIVAAAEAVEALEGVAAGSQIPGVVTGTLSTAWAPLFEGIVEQFQEINWKTVFLPIPDRLITNDFGDPFFAVPG